MRIVRYTSKNRETWNQFLLSCKNSTFLMNRHYMDYHSYHFIDYSLMIYQNDRLIGLVPANLKYDQLVSHEGLTYGGILLQNIIKFNESIDVFKAILEYLSKEGIVTFILKLTPRFYLKTTADDFDWILFKVNAKIIRKDSAFVIDNSKVRLNYQERRKRSIKKAQKLNFSIDEGYSLLKPFWQEILMPNLLEKHGVSPVHSLYEIEKLASNFPENVKQYIILLDGNIVAGCTIFETENVAHAQYISGNEIGRNSGCLDLLFDWLINERYKEKQYFDFGIANEEMGQKINQGLMDWKEGFGARAMSHDFYEINTCNFNLLEDIYC